MVRVFLGGAMRDASMVTRIPLSNHPASRGNPDTGGVVHGAISINPPCESLLTGNGREDLWRQISWGAMRDKLLVSLTANDVLFEDDKDF